MTNLRYQRVLLKLSGEALAGPQGFGIDPDRATLLAETVKSVHELGAQVAVVIGASFEINNIEVNGSCQW